MEYLTPKQYGERLDPPVSQRRVNDMCNKGQIPGAIRIGGRAWAIPSNAKAIRNLKYRKKEG